MLIKRHCDAKADFHKQVEKKTPKTRKPSGSGRAKTGNCQICCRCSNRSRSWYCIMGGGQVGERYTCGTRNWRIRYRLRLQLDHDCLLSMFPGSLILAWVRSLQILQLGHVVSRSDHQDKFQFSNSPLSFSISVSASP